MDSELTSIASVKALNQGVATTDSPTFAAATVTGEITANAGIALPDSQKATFGASDDLQIFHDGSNSYIQDQGLSGTGNLILAGADVEIATFGGNKYFLGSSNVARLYHTNNEKLATTATGIDVTGDVNTSGLLKVGTNDTEYANNYVRFKPTGAAYIDHSTVGQPINFRVSGSSSLDTNALTINSTGNVKINAAGSLLIRDDGTFIKEDGGLQIGNTSGTGTTRPIRFYTESAERFRIASDGSLSTPTAGTSNVRFGVNAGNSIVSGGNYNVVVGDEAGTAITTGDENTFIGYQSGDSNTTARYNTAVGKGSLSSTTTGESNVAIGRDALLSNTTGPSNTAVGKSALVQNTTGRDNTAVGFSAAATNTTGVENVAMGMYALRFNTTGGSNTALGYLALHRNTTASNNTAVGRYALEANTTGTLNTAVGKDALSTNTTSSNNTAMGYRALRVSKIGRAHV
jgi:hypothetical protein